MRETKPINPAFLVMLSQRRMPVGTALTDFRDLLYFTFRLKTSIYGLRVSQICGSLPTVLNCERSELAGPRILFYSKLNTLRRASHARDKLLPFSSCRNLGSWLGDNNNGTGVCQKPSEPCDGDQFLGQCEGKECVCCASELKNYPIIG